MREPDAGSTAGSTRTEASTKVSRSSMSAPALVATSSVCARVVQLTGNSANKQKRRDLPLCTGGRAGVPVVGEEKAKGSLRADFVFFFLA